VQVDHELQFGVKITNDSNHTVLLKAINVGEQAAGLTVHAKQFGTCGMVGGNTDNGLTPTGGFSNLPRVAFAGGTPTVRANRRQALV
jgi:hypothetical protein